MVVMRRNMGRWFIGLVVWLAPASPAWATDLLDFERFFACATGPDGGLGPGCGVFDDDGDNDVDLVDFSAFQLIFTGPSMNATYRVTFTGTWSAQTHPINYPSGSHFSGLIGATHNSNITFWQVGGLASPGIEQMAETGGTSLLLQQGNQQIALGNAWTVITGPGMAPSPGVATTTFNMTQAYPLATLVTMIAPTPDWFVGVSGLELFTGQVWLPDVVVSLQPYDAGTDSGVNYTSPNADTQPHVPIAEITWPPLSPGGPAVPLGTFRFQRIN